MGLPAVLDNAGRAGVELPRQAGARGGRGGSRRARGAPGAGSPGRGVSRASFRMQDFPGVGFTARASRRGASPQRRASARGASWVPVSPARGFRARGFTARASRRGLPRREFSGHGVSGAGFPVRNSPAQTSPAWTSGDGLHGAGSPPLPHSPVRGFTALPRSPADVSPGGRGGAGEQVFSELPALCGRDKTPPRSFARRRE